ncbi:MAG: Gfo/Idh/MocA family oxidoreductase [Kiritimatiellae bacterium]|nr:Gfo/Idh/MocA family oxidoreductase [Kiritimatiellia bacterium]
MSGTTRRGFLGGSASLAAAGLPSLFNIGCAGFGRSRSARLASGGKIRLGLAGCGGRMGLSTGYGILNHFCDDCEIVCIADPDPERWALTRAVVKARQPATDAGRIRAFRDYREMLDRCGGELDAVAVATPNHHHALAAVTAMRMGLHVYVEKPMALTVEEVKLMLAESRRSGVVTQVGNQGHSEEDIRRLVEHVRAGTIGEVREVWTYDDRVNAMPYRPPSAPPPARMDWDSWCGPAPVCDYYAPTKDHNGMHPHDWHDWIGYGNGSIGNMGTHILDPVFWALGLGSPASVTARRADWGCEGSWTVATELEWKFPSRGSMPPVTVHWFDGLREGIPYTSEYVDGIGVCRKRGYQHLPPVVEELERKYGMELGNLGAVFIGERGIARIAQHGGELMFGPAELAESPAPEFIPRETGLDHYNDWIRAIRNPSRGTGCGFEYSAPLAEMVLLGNVAPRAGVGRKLRWDGTRVTNCEEANAFLRTTYRKGWELA